MVNNLVYALVLSALAAAATVAGSLLGMSVRRPGPRFMAFSLGFSAGVMLLVSFAELLRVGIEALGVGLAMVCFFAGLAGMFLVDLLVPHRFVAEQKGPADRVCEFDSVRLLRLGLLVALGIGIHNFPEGMATFMGAMHNRGLGAAIALGIALHNIPEGMAVGVPVFCATGSRRKALSWSALSGGMELVGALLAAAILMPFFTPRLLAGLLAVVAGLMVFVALDELIPGSYEYGREHASVAGVFSGMGMMALSIWLLT